MTSQLDQAISDGITEILRQAQLSPEMTRMIETSLNAESQHGEIFNWAHLTLLSCDCAGGEPEKALPGAIAMELSALAADIFDDIQDQDNDGLPWRQIPTANTMNLAICLSMLSFKALSRLPDGKDDGLRWQATQILSHLWTTFSDGQFQEVFFDSSNQVTLEQYFELVKRKSGCLTACASKIGATLACAPGIMPQLELWGENLGIMSQIRNDLNDFLNFDKKKDFVNNKKTLPYVYLLNVLKGNAAEQFQGLTEKAGQEFGKEEQDSLKQLAVAEGAVHYCRVMYEMYREKSLEIIQTIPVPQKRKEKMIRFVEKNN